MRIRFLAVAVLVSATTLVAAPGSSSPPDSVVTTEQDCTEAAYVRGGDPADVRALVPARYELVTNLAGAALSPASPGSTRESGVEVDTLPAGSTSATWTVAGGGGTTPARSSRPSPRLLSPARRGSTTRAGRRLVLTYENHFSQASGRLTGDLSATPSGALSFLSPVLSDVSAVDIRGGWTATLSVVE